MECRWKWEEKKIVQTRESVRAGRLKLWKKIISNTTERRRETRLWSYSRCTRKADEGVWTLNKEKLNLICTHESVSLWSEPDLLSCAFPCFFLSLTFVWRKEERKKDKLFLSCLFLLLNIIPDFDHETKALSDHYYSLFPSLLRHGGDNIHPFD